jgi:hypothetical protein
MSARILLTVALLLALSSAAYAQRRGREPPPKPEEFNGEGTIEGISPSLIQMKTKANETVYVGVLPITMVRLTGTATADFLRTGLCVEFTGEVSKTLVVKDKITQLTVFPPSPDMPLGLYPEGAAPGGKGNDFGGDGFGEAPAKGKKGARRGNAEGADAFGASGDAPAGRKGKGAGSSVQLPGVCTVRGKITGVHGTSLTVSAGKPVKAELDENVEIAVTTSDHTLASKGDSISVVGQAAQKGKVLAKSVRIEASQKLGGVAKKGRGKAVGTKTDHAEKVEKVTNKSKPAAKKEGVEPAAVEPAAESKTAPKPAAKAEKAEPKSKPKPKAKGKDEDEAPLPG